MKTEERVILFTEVYKDPAYLIKGSSRKGTPVWGKRIIKSYVKPFDSIVVMPKLTLGSVHRILGREGKDANSRGGVFHGEDIDREGENIVNTTSSGGSLAAKGKALGSEGVWPRQ